MAQTTWQIKNNTNNRGGNGDGVYLVAKGVQQCNTLATTPTTLTMQWTHNNMMYHEQHQQHNEPM
jgi:hypothetical protein